MNYPSNSLGLPFVWELRYQGNISYAIGTHHITRKNYKTPLETFLSKTNSLLTEIDLKTTGYELFDQMPDRRAGDLGLSKEGISALERSIDIPFQIWREFPPPIIPVLIFRRHVSLFPQPMEGYLVEAAKNSDKPIISLETIDERISYSKEYADEFLNLFRREIAREILSPGYLPKRCQDGEEIFESGDISAYRKHIRGHILPGTSERDKKMFERSVLHIKEESCTIATGIVHMIRRGGLLDMYSNAGIRINRLGYDRDKTKGQKANPIFINPPWLPNNNAWNEHAPRDDKHPLLQPEKGRRKRIA